MTTHDASATIAQLFIHPIKSCAAVAVDEAVLTPTGLQYDRHWMVTKPDGQFITQRSHARMALIVPSIQNGHLIVNAPNMPPLALSLVATGELTTVQVWKSTVSAFDMGDLAAEWFSLFLGEPLRLMRFNADQPRLCSQKWTGEHTATTEFADGYPLLITTSSAVDELNQKLTAQGHNEVDQRRFRPNIVLADLPAHDEDLIDELHLDSESPIVIKNVKPCERCPIPSIDPDTAVYQPEAVGDTLQTYRHDTRLDGAITFGMNAIIIEGAEQIVRVGQTVGVNYAF